MGYKLAEVFIETEKYKDWRSYCEFALSEYFEQLVRWRHEREFVNFLMNIYQSICVVVGFCYDYCV